MRKIKVMSVFGTRPEAIKMAPLVKELERREEIESYVCLTGQHREMLDSVMEIFDLKADFDLNIMEKRQTLSTITTKTLLGMEKVFEENKPDLILVHGDTSTTFAGALAAFYHQVKVGACRSRASHVGQVFALPGGNEPDVGGRYRGPSFFAHEGERGEPAPRVGHGRCLHHRQHGDRRDALHRIGKFPLRYCRAG